MGDSLKDYLILIFLWFLCMTEEQRQQRINIFLYETKNNLR